MRSVETFLLEAELLASPPQAVYDWLKERGAKVNRVFDDHGGDEELEEALLARADPLIDLGLARFCVHGSIAKRLFSRALGNKNELNHARALRLAALSNQVLGKSNLFGFPDALFKNEELYRWLEFLRDLLEGNEPWQALSEDGRLASIFALSNNERVRRPYDDTYLDGWDEYMYHGVSTAAWKLAEKVPTTPVRAMSLARLYCSLRRERVLGLPRFIGQICIGILCQWVFSL
ncbi:hypothetical protein [Cupriavidus sp. CuC1]|uniref:hypothetical protein n=1 Tax=Cupriavidus sp. CuC1 TaxID=3373131 RepID=UPI0037D7679C